MTQLPTTAPCILFSPWNQPSPIRCQGRGATRRALNGMVKVMKKTSTPISPRTSTGMDFPESESRALAATFPALMRNGGSRLKSSGSVEQQRRIVTLAHEIDGTGLGADNIRQSEDLLQSQSLG